jgi:hypothetical protein
MALVVCVRGLLLWSLGMMIAAYLGGAAALTYWFHRKPHNHIAYGDVVSAPWQWSHFNALRGQANIDQARDALKDRNLRAAFALFRSGVARNPDDSKARLELATVFTIFRIRPEAEKLLVKGFDHTYPGHEYLVKAVAIIEAGDNPEFLLGFCARARAALAATPSPSPGDERYLNETTVKTLISLGRLDEAVSSVEAFHPLDPVRLAKTKITRALVGGDIAKALAELDPWLTASPDNEQALATAVRVYREAGKLSEMQAAILRLRSRYPENPEHISLALSECLLAGQSQPALDLLDISFYRFVNKPTAFGQWADAIGKTGRDDVLARLEQLMRDSNLNPQSVLFATLMTDIRKQSWAEAQAADVRLDALYPNVHPRIQDLHRVAKALLEVCRQPVMGAQNTLTASIAGGWLGLPYYRQIIDCLVATERYEAAGEVLTLAEGYYPTSRYIAAARPDLAAKLAAQNSALAQNSAKAAVPAPRLPANAAALLAILDANEKSGRNDESLHLLRAVRSAKPAWLRTALPNIEWREIQIAAEAGDISLLQLDLRTRLHSRAKTDIDRILALAQKWRGESRDSVALVAVREVLKTQPANNVALALLTQWSPSAEPAASATDAANTTAAASAVAPATPIPSSAQDLLKTLDDQIAANSADDALRLIRAVRRADPDWLGAALPELEWREILLAVRSGDLPLLQINLRTHLRTHPDAGARCLTQARAWHTEGKDSAALVVVKEVLRQTPDDPDARRLLAEWSLP